LTNDELQFRTTALKNGFAITDIQVEKLGRFAALLRDWNQRINLISRKDEENIWSYHLLHSAALVFTLDLKEGVRILDLGTGGGLPGIPLAILLPGTSFVLLDSIRKKIGAVGEMIGELGLPNATAVCSRAEDLGSSPSYARSFDAVIARGVAQLDLLIEWGKPFLKRKGAAEPSLQAGGKRTALAKPAIVAMKGGETGDELAKAHRRFPSARIRTVEMVFEGGESLRDSGKQLIIVEDV